MLDLTNAVFPELNRFDRFSIDTETTGLSFNDYPVSMSLSTPDGKDYWFSWGHPEGNNCSLSQVIKWAKRELTRTNQNKIMYNGVYDWRMCRKVGIPLAGVVEDPGISCALLNEHTPPYTLEAKAMEYCNMAKQDEELNRWCAKQFSGQPTRESQAKNYHKAPGTIVGPYGMQDSRMTLALQDVTQPLIVKAGLFDVYWLETMVIPVLVKMYFAGVRTDLVKARKVKKDLYKEEVRLQHELDQLLDEPVNVGSPKDLKRLFDSLGIPYPYTPVTTKTRKKAGKRNGIQHEVGDTYQSGGNPSFAKEFLDSLDHPVGQLIRGRRKVGHYANTFVEGYILSNADEQGFIHPSFHSVRSAFGGTITGRFSSAGGLNAQNVPARDDVYAPLIRSMFIPISKDHFWLKCDYSQIEYRFLAHYAGGQLREAYLKDPDRDFHEMVAEMTGLNRRQAKNINFAKVYGAGAKKVALMMGVSEAEAQKFIDQYEQRIPEAKKVYYRAMNLGSRRGYVKTWGGRINRFEYGSEQTKYGWKKGYKKVHSALNKVLQGSSADLTKHAMVAVDQLIDWESEVLHLTVHDELDFSLPKGSAGLKKARLIKETMEDFELSVPIRCEAAYGPDWGHAKEAA